MFNLKNPFKVCKNYFSHENRIKRTFSCEKYNGITIIFQKNNSNFKKYEYAVLVDPNIYTHEIAIKLFDVSYAIYNKKDYISRAEKQNFYLTLRWSSAPNIRPTEYFNTGYSIHELKTTIDKFINKMNANKISIKLGK